jgi:hypothetical protein
MYTFSKAVAQWPAIRTPVFSVSAPATAKGRAAFCAEIEVYAQSDKTTVLICVVDIADLCVDAVTVDNLIFGTGAKPCIAFTGNIDKTNISNG